MKYIVTQDIATRNLRVVAGQVLPDTWQRPHLMQFLRKKYGDDVIQRIDRKSNPPETKKRGKKDGKI